MFVPCDLVSRNSTFVTSSHPVSVRVGKGCGKGEGREGSRTEQKITISIQAINKKRIHLSRRRLISIARDAVHGVCCYSITLPYCATSMADTDAIRKQKKAERNKRYRLKRKMEMQQEASTTSETELAKSKRRKPEYDKQHQLKRKIEMQQSEIELEIPKTYT